MFVNYEPKCSRIVHIVNKKRFEKIKVTKRFSTDLATCRPSFICFSSLFMLINTFSQGKRFLKPVPIQLESHKCVTDLNSPFHTAHPPEL